MTGIEPNTAWSDTAKGWGAVKYRLKSLKCFILNVLKSSTDGGGRRGCGGIGRATQRSADPGHPVRRFKVPLVRPPRTPGSAPPTRAAPEPISLPLARRTPPQRHDRMARSHGACGASTLRHGWVLDFNDLIARVRDKVAAAECRRAFLKCEIDQIGLCARAPAAPVAALELVDEWPETPGSMRAVSGPAECGGEEACV
jgi:hypothetical protein